ncbi:MAG: metalloprotease [Novosphingobium lindaniclasticum]|nr:metalloprotease [Novosphingobium lindaniclasticum]
MTDHTISRREFSLCSLLVVTLRCACSPVAASGQTMRGGCWIPEDRMQPYFDRSEGGFAFHHTGNEPMNPHSGDRSLDMAMAKALSSISAEFGVLPAFGFYREASNGKNALATKRRALNRADGTVLFGLNLLNDLLQLKINRDAAIVAVCAHEYGHIVASKLNIQTTLNPSGIDPFRSEQFADYISGFYAGIRKLRNINFPAVAFAVQQGRSGGPDHGTGKQRSDAVIAGFKNAFEHRMNTSDGIEAGVNFAMAQPMPSSE